MKRSTAGAFAALMFPAAAMAQSSMDSMTKAITGPDSGWYVGGSVGQSKLDVDTSNIPGVTDKDDTDTAFRVFGGYMFNRNFGAELGYADLGSAKITAGGLDNKFEAKTWDLAVVGVLPIADKFSLYGKLGWYFPDVKLSGGGASQSDSGSDLTYTVGVGYDFTRNLGLRADWQRYQSMGDMNKTGEADVDVYSIGVVYRFK